VRAEVKQLPIRFVSVLQRRHQNVGLHLVEDPTRFDSAPVRLEAMGYLHMEEDPPSRVSVGT
jgi:hypothetical protein